MSPDRFSASAHHVDEMHQNGSRMGNAPGHFQPIRTPMNTPALNAVVVAVMDMDSEKPTARARSTKSIAAFVALGVVVGGLGLLGSRGELHSKAVAHAARICGLNTTCYVFSVVATLRQKQVDADWTPPPLDAKPWQPTPYVPILPSTVADAPASAATFFVPPVLSAAPPAPIATSAPKATAKKSKTGKNAS